MRFDEHLIHCPFNDLGPLHAALDAFGAIKLDETFHSEGVQLHIRLPADHSTALALRLRDSSRNRIQMKTPAHAQT